MSVTINDFSHYAYHDDYVYIYKTPDSADYTIQVIGVNIPDEVTTASERFTLDKEFAMGLVWRTLSFIADLNGDSQRSDRFLIKSNIYMNKMDKKASRKNYLLDKIQPYSFLD